MTEKICSKCKGVFNSEKDFYIDKQTKDGKSSYCKKCHDKYTTQYNKIIGYKHQKKYVKKNRQLWVEFLRNNNLDVCSVCGYNKCFNAIDFHHKNPKEKKFHISVFIQRNSCCEENKQTLLKEIDKCMILCSNCHKELHYWLSNK